MVELLQHAVVRHLHEELAVGRRERLGDAQIHRFAHPPRDVHAGGYRPHQGAVLRSHEELRQVAVHLRRQQLSQFAIAGDAVANVHIGVVQLHMQIIHLAWRPVETGGERGGEFRLQVGIGTGNHMRRHKRSNQRIECVERLIDAVHLEHLAKTRHHETFGVGDAHSEIIDRFVNDAEVRRHVVEGHFLEARGTAGGWIAGVRRVLADGAFGAVLVVTRLGGESQFAQSRAGVRVANDRQGHFNEQSVEIPRRLGDANAACHLEAEVQILNPLAAALAAHGHARAPARQVEEAAGEVPRGHAQVRAIRVLQQGNVELGDGFRLRRAVAEEVRRHVWIRTREHLRQAFVLQFRRHHRTRRELVLPAEAIGHRVGVVHHRAHGFVPSELEADDVAHVFAHAGGRGGFDEAGVRLALRVVLHEHVVAEVVEGVAGRHAHGAQGEFRVLLIGGFLPQRRAVEGQSVEERVADGERAGDVLGGAPGVGGHHVAEVAVRGGDEVAALRVAAVVARRQNEERPPRRCGHQGRTRMAFADEVVVVVVAKAGAIVAGGEAGLVVVYRVAFRARQDRGEVAVRPRVAEVGVHAVLVAAGGAVLVAAGHADAGVVLLEDDVHHAAHRVRAVHGAAAVEQHLHLFDGRGGDVAHVGEEAVDAGGAGDPPPVHQHQRVARAEAAQIRRGKADVQRAQRHIEEGGEVRGVVEGVDRGQVLRDRPQDLLGGGEAPGVDLLRRQHLHAQRGIVAQAGAGDHHHFAAVLPERLRVLGVRPGAALDLPTAPRRRQPIAAHVDGVARRRRVGRGALRRVRFRFREQGGRRGQRGRRHKRTHIEVKHGPPPVQSSRLPANFAPEPCANLTPLRQRPRTTRGAASAGQIPERAQPEIPPSTRALRRRRTGRFGCGPSGRLAAPAQSRTGRPRTRRAR